MSIGVLKIWKSLNPNLRVQDFCIIAQVSFWNITYSRAQIKTRYVRWNDGFFKYLIDVRYSIEFNLKKIKCQLIIILTRKGHEAGSTESDNSFYNDRIQLVDKHIARKK